MIRDWAAPGSFDYEHMIVPNGSRPGSPLFLVDGANNTNRQGRTIVLTPSIDEIEEFRVSGANLSAEVGYGTNVMERRHSYWHQQLPWSSMGFSPISVVLRSSGGMQPCGASLFDGICDAVMGLALA
jgi:hypothetical protein